MSPGLPHRYGNNMDCVYHIRSSNNMVITLRLEAINMEETTDCEKDYLQVDISLESLHVLLLFMSLMKKYKYNQNPLFKKTEKSKTCRVSCRFSI